MALKNVVFTGEAEDARGRPVLRDVLKKAATARGFMVQSSVQASTDCLVASRGDTVKAKAAKARGLLVVTYAEFCGMLQMVERLGEQELSRPGTYDHNADYAIPDGVAKTGVTLSLLEQGAGKYEL